MMSKRMIFDLPDDVQMAIRLRAVKDRMTTGEVVSHAIERTFGEDIQEARALLAEREKAKQ